MRKLSLAFAVAYDAAIFTVGDTIVCHRWVEYKMKTYSEQEIQYIRGIAAYISCASPGDAKYLNPSETFTHEQLFVYNRIVMAGLRRVEKFHRSCIRLA